MHLIWISILSALVAGASDFVDSDALTLQTRTTYFVSLTVEGQPVELALDAAQYQLLAKLKKLSLREVVKADEKTDELVASINAAAVKSFGKALVIKSEEGYYLHRPVANPTNLLFQVLNRGMFYRGEEVSLTDKETEIMKALSAAPDRTMTYEDLAQAVNWQGRNYRTNVRTYMESINKKTFEATGTDLLKVEGRGKAIQIDVSEPANYSGGGYSRVHGRIVALEGNAFAVAESLTQAIRERLPSRGDIHISEAEFKTLNLSPAVLAMSVRAIYEAAGVSREYGGIAIRYGDNEYGLSLNGSDGHRLRVNKRFCGDVL